MPEDILKKSFLNGYLSMGFQVKRQRELVKELMGVEHVISASLVSSDGDVTV